MRRFFGFFIFVFTMFMSLAAHAGFRAYNGTTDLKVMQGITCASGVNCTVGKNAQLVIATDGSNALRTRQAATGAQTLTSSACGKTIYNTAASVQTLPLASTVLGCRITFVTANASNFDVNPNNADRILGLTDAIGDAIRNATLGNSVMLEATAALQWSPITAPYGTWTDVN